MLLLKRRNELVMPVTNMYNETMSYDRNGNIQTLLRTGDMDNDDNNVPAFTIDDLTYTYDGNEQNKLMKVTDGSFISLGFTDDDVYDPGDNSNDYKYDAKGNMTQDDNKAISLITYNHPNLPLKIKFTNENNIKYLYNALGQKVLKTVTIDTVTVDTDYLDSFQYVDGQLRFFPHAEGYVNATYCEECGKKGTYNVDYVYNYTDHLGNIRLSYGFDQKEAALEILEENHYYPFGLKHTNYNGEQQTFVMEDEEPNLSRIEQDAEDIVYKYKYNGKEWQDELGLNMYDYGAMMYDPALGRRNNIDPKAEESRRWSPYSYCYNNPLSFIDPDGMKAMMWQPDKNGNLVAEKGDNKQTLAKFLGVKANQITLTASTGKGNPENIKEGDVVTLDNNVTRAISNSDGVAITPENPSTKGWDTKDMYVCWDGAQMAVNGDELTPANAEKYDQFPNQDGKTPGFSEVKSFENTQFNGGVATIKGSTHVVSYYGKSNDGTVYVMSKNGMFSKPQVYPLSEVLSQYNATTKDVKYYEKK